jgi:hypothetical protein
VQHEREASPVDERVLQMLEDHCPWEALDDVILTIINQTYAALLEILGGGCGGGPVKVGQLVYAIDSDPPASASASASPIPCVVEASATHCHISLVDGSGLCEYTNSFCQLMQTRRQLQERRASVSTWPRMVRLARVDDDGGGAWNCAGNDDRPDVVSEEGFLNVLEIRPGVCEKALLGVLDTVRSHLGSAIEVETSMVRMARTGNKLKDIFTVRIVLESMRREVDLRAIMSRRMCVHRTHRHAGEISRRRTLGEMDVDQVDEAEVLTKRLKAMHV